MSKDNKGRYMVSFILRDRISTIVDAYDKADAIEQGHKYLENCFTSRFQITTVLRDRGRGGDTQVIELTNQGILNPEDIQMADKYAQTKAKMNIGGVNLREKENE